MILGNKVFQSTIKQQGEPKHLKKKHFKKTFKFNFNHNFNPNLQLNKYETAPNFNHQPKLDIGLFVDLAGFPCFYAVLAWPDLEIVMNL